jgi:hypothetical protein
MTIIEAAAILRPGTAWNLRGDKLEQALDDTPRVECPTLPELQAVMESNAYAEKRRSEYPALSDQLDAIWKGGSDLEAMRAKIEEVKAKYPKPGA